MIINLPHFIKAEQPFWDEMAALLDRLANDPQTRLSLDESRRLHYLYERAASDLIRLSTFASAPEVSTYLEGLVARAYGEIHEVRERRTNNIWRWIFKTFPRTFRRHLKPLGLATTCFMVGAFFGAFVLWAIPDSKVDLLPDFSQEKPSERVSREMVQKGKPLATHHTEFAGQLITHNVKCGIFTLALGMTYGIGSVIYLFYNGFTIGAVIYDYVHDGQTTFMIGWLLPHGSIEIPSLLIAGQAAFVLAHALIGSRSKRSIFARLRDCRDDVMTLTGGFAMLLIWAGITESFFSQYHEPVIPYSAKIIFGCVQLTMLTLYLGTSGRKPDAAPELN